MSNRPTTKYHPSPKYVPAVEFEIINRAYINAHRLCFTVIDGEGKQCDLDFKYRTSYDRSNAISDKLYITERGKYHPSAKYGTTSTRRYSQTERYLIGSHPRLENVVMDGLPIRYYIPSIGFMKYDETSLFDPQYTNPFGFGKISAFGFLVDCEADAILALMKKEY